jgi:preprotein translocase subunit SecE
MATDKSVATVKPAKRGATPPAQAARPAPRPGGDGFFNKASKYLTEVRTELKKATWPSKPELIAQTQVVLGLLVLIGVFIAGWDFVLTQIFRGVEALLGVRHR